MKTDSPREENAGGEYNERFLEFMRLFADMDTDENLFPRECRVCGTHFGSIREYFCATIPKGHCFENYCKPGADSGFMLLYRHCKCGNTLVLTLKEKEFPELNSFWQMLREEADDSERSLKEVVSDFADQCDCYLLSVINPCKDK
ncbi:MAG TPA: hypothetical protein VK463_01510 [Desulfomonilaceae bacterium]|nr:hypothetical protein [Desulfomonilaceae bacterium]